MTDSLVIVGLSHRTAPVALREKAALSEAATQALLRSLRREALVREAVALSTCNRTELVAVADDPGRCARALAAALVRETRLGAPELASAGYELHGPEATAHLFRVAASLDSMVVGESEIQGQVRAAWRLAARERTAGPALDELFHRALAVGKRVRRETRLGAGPLSVPSVAVDLARRAFDDLSRRSVMVIGAGEMARATAQALRYRGLSGVVVANRSLPAARALAADFGGRAIPLEAVPKALAGVDIVISSTEAPHPLLSREDVEWALASRRRRRPLVLIDIAVPRDLDAGIADVENVLLYDIDDLERLAAANRAGRRREAQRAEQLVDAEVRRVFAAARRRLVAA
jgi:glutamyl-tRNA reductase